MRRTTATLTNQQVTVRSGDTTCTGECDLQEDHGIWVKMNAAQAPAGIPRGLYVRLFFPFAQMQWLAVADE